MKIVTTNKKAYFDYFIEETYEAGIELQGSEVKSIRGGHMNLKDSYAIVKGNEIFLINAHISPYEKGSHYNPEPKRARRLLLHKEEIRKIKAKVAEKGYTLVATKVYFKQALVKVELGIGKGKQNFDKRRAIQEKEQKRSVDRMLKEQKYK